MNEDDARHKDAREHFPDDGSVRLNLTITAQPTATGDGRYLGACLINGVPHRIELIPVEDGPNGWLQATTAPWDDTIDALMLVDGAASPYQTIADEVGGRYVCTIMPSCM